jgi:hypothetical protein
MSSFDDIADELNGMNGIFAGEGTQALKGVTAKLAEDGSGYSFFVLCQGCGRSTRVDVTWPELIYISEKRLAVDPDSRQQWIYDPHRGGVYPPGSTRCCKVSMPLLLNADEATRYVKNGIAAKKLHPGRVQQIVATLKRR